MPRESTPMWELAEALGVELNGLRKVVLTLEPVKLPRIEATYQIRDNGGVAESVRRLELVSLPAAGCADVLYSVEPLADGAVRLIVFGPGGVVELSAAMAGQLAGLLNPESQ